MLGWLAGEAGGGDHGELTDAECTSNREHLPVRVCPGNGKSVVL